MGRLLLIIFLSAFSVLANGQVTPAEGSKLNYRIIGLSFLPKNGASKYKIEIAPGNYNSVDSFKSRITQTLYSETDRIIAEVHSFGCDYTWRVTYENDKKSNPENIFHHFSTMPLPEKDQERRLRILQPAVQKYKDAYVFLDNYTELFDMDGQPVWFMPENTSDARNTLHGASIRDIKLSGEGTITYVAEPRAAYEINYNGDILWRMPENGQVSGEQRELCHHEFTRLSNGHYMVLGQETEIWNHHLPSADSSYLISPLSEKVNKEVKRTEAQVAFGTVIEYDQYGNVVWSWKSSDYFRYSDIYYNNKGIATHENAFSFDEKNEVLYVSFRDINRILKVKYPEGKVIGSYGEIFSKDNGGKPDDMFYGQHSIKKSQKGYLYLYDNNSAEPGNFPKILKLEEPQRPSGHLKKIWEYDCTGEGILPEEQKKFNVQSKDGINPIYDFRAGGNVIELPDNSFFVDMAGSYNKVFIVSPGKEILWSAVPEEWSSGAWRMTAQYRASMVSKEEMKNLVWGTGNKDVAKAHVENQLQNHSSTNE